MSYKDLVTRFGRKTGGDEERAKLANVLDTTQRKDVRNYQRRHQVRRNNLADLSFAIQQVHIHGDPLSWHHEQHRPRYYR